MNSKPRPNQKINITIERLGIHGEGIGYLDGYTVFVDGALPGENIDAWLTHCKKNYARAKLLKNVTPSSSRVTPPCPVFGECGGCQVMHLDYSSQLEMKRQRVVDAFERIGKITDCDVLPCLPSPSPLAYRNKIQVPVRSGPDGLRLGFYKRNSHDLVDVDHCYIHCDLGEKVYKETSRLLKASNVTAYDLRNHRGELRFVIIKTAVNTEQALVIFVTNGKASAELKRVSNAIIKNIPEVQGVVQNINTTQSNVVLGRQFNVLEGEGSITEKILDQSFKVSPASFFQVNPSQAEQLYKQAIAFADLTGEETLLDAYCGVGTLGLVMAPYAKRVIGVECVPQAIEDAKENARLNGAANIEFVCEEMENWIKDAKDLDVVVLNPPRKGCDASFLAELERLRPKRIVYISCDPATLARDLAELRDYGYSIDAVQPVDMFPQTAHVETVVKLSL